MHDELARRTCTRLVGFPDAAASVNALLEKRISADEAMNAWTGGLEAAWTARNDPELHAQLLLAYGRNGPLVGPLDPRAMRALIEDAHAAFVEALPPRLAGLAIALEMARDGNPSALESALATIPVTAAEVKSLLSTTPRFDEARGKKIEIVGEHAHAAHDLLGRVASSFSAMMGAFARGNPAAEEQAAKFDESVAAMKGGDLSRLQELVGQAMSFADRPRQFDAPAPLARLGGAVVSVRVEGATILAMDDQGAATRIDLGGEKPPEALRANAPPVPPLEGMRDPGSATRAWVSLADDTVLAVGGDEESGGWIAVGKRSDGSWSFVDDYEAALLCMATDAGRHLVGCSDGTALVFDEDLALAGGADVAEGDPVTAIAWLPGDRLVAGTASGAVIVTDVLA